MGARHTFVTLLRFTWILLVACKPKGPSKEIYTAMGSPPNVPDYRCDVISRSGDHDLREPWRTFFLPILSVRMFCLGNS